MALDLGELVAFLDLDTSKFDKATDRMPGKISGKAAAFGAAGLVIGGVIAAAMTKGLTDAISFEDSLATVSGQLALTEAESARVGAAAGRVYAQNYGESVEQVQGAVAGVVTQIEGMGTASDAVVDKMTAKVLNYADAFGVDTADAIAMVQQLMSNGLATSADEAMDLMTASMQRVPEALRGDLADAVTEYGPLLAQMGFTGQQAFELLASGADQGMYGIDKAGDALKEFGIRVSDLGDSGAQDALASLGFSGEDMAARMAAGGDTAKAALDEIVGGLLGMEDPAARANAAIALFGTPLEDLGVAQIPDFLGSLQGLGDGMTDTAGAADAMAETMGGSTASQMEAMNRQVEIMMSDLMSGLLPVLNAVFGFMADNPAVVQGLAIALGILAVAFLGVAAAMWAASLTPISLIIGAIIIGIGLLVAAIVWLVQNWDAVWAAITDIWNGFMSWLGEVFGAIGEWFASVWNSIASFFTGLWQGMVDFVTGVFSGFASWLQSVGDGIASWWNGLWESIGSFFSDTWNGIVTWATSLISNFVAGWQIVWGRLTSFFSGLWSGIGNGIRAAWDGILSFFGGIPDTILGFFSGVGQWLWNVGRDLIQGLLNGISSLASTIGNFFLSLLPDWIVGPFKAALGIASPSKLFAEYGRNTVEGYLRGIEGMQPGLDKRMGELVDTPALAATVNTNGTTAADVDTKGAGSSMTVNYYASEDRGLSSEEALFAALGSPRVTLARGWE